MLVGKFRTRIKPIPWCVNDILIAEREVVGLQDLLGFRRPSGKQPRDKMEKGKPWRFLLRSLLHRESILTSEAY